MDEQDVRDWMAAMLDTHDKGMVSAKTINNARAALSSALSDATAQRLLARNPCALVAPLPVDRPEFTTYDSPRSTATCTPAPPTTGR
jgi:hypothetical protein